MATRKQTAKQLLQIPSADIDKMTEKELRATVQILASAANKRLKRLGATEAGRMSPAYQSAMQRSYTGAQGGKFGTEGKTRNQLRNEYKALKAFMETKTGSVQKWNAYKKKVYKRLGGDFGNDVDKESEFWKTYRKVEELHPEIRTMQYGSKETQADLRRVVNEQNTRDIMLEINRNNVSKRRKNRDEYIESLTDNGYIINDNHRRVKIDVNDNDDVLYLMSMRVGAAYEQEQSTTGSDEFITVQRNKWS